MLAGLPKLRRWAANWVRLLLLLSPYRPPADQLYRFRDRASEPLFRPLWISTAPLVLVERGLSSSSASLSFRRGFSGS